MVGTLQPVFTLELGSESNGSWNQLHSPPDMLNGWWDRFGLELPFSLRHQQESLGYTWSKPPQSSKFHPWCFHQAHPPQMIQSPLFQVFPQSPLDALLLWKNSSANSTNTSLLPYESLSDTITTQKWSDKLLS